MENVAEQNRVAVSRVNLCKHDIKSSLSSELFLEFTYLRLQLHTAIQALHNLGKLS